MMKWSRLLSLALTLCLLCSAALAEVAVVPGSRTDQEAEAAGRLEYAPEGLFAVGGRLYAQTYSYLYQAVEGGWVKKLNFNEIGSIITSAATEEGLYLMIRGAVEYDQQTDSYIYPEGGLYAMTFVSADAEGNLGEPSELCRIKWDISDDDWPTVEGMQIVDGRAYLLVHDDSDWNQCVLYGVDLASGEGKRITKDCLSELTAYKDGKLLARRFSYEEAWDEKGNLLNPPQIVSVDTQTGEMAEMCRLQDMESGAMVYDAATDGLYYADSSYVYRFAAGFASAEPVGYLMSGNTSRNGHHAVIFEGRYYVGDWSDENYMASATIDPALLPTRSLRLSSVWAVDDVVREWVKAHPEVAVEYTDSPLYDAETFRSHMESPQAADIYGISLPYSPYAPLLKYGLLADLSGSETLMNTVGRMYPNLTEAYLKDGKLYGLPVSISGNVMGYYPRAWEKVGLTDEDLPATYDELMTFIADWYYDFYDEFEEMSIFEWTPELRSSLVSMIFEAQIVACQAQGKQITFRTPTIQKLLSRLDSDEMKRVIDALGPKRAENGIIGGLSVVYVDGAEWYEDSSLFSSYYSVMPSRYRRWGEGAPLLLRLDEDTEPYINASVNLLIINRASKNQDLAMELMEYIAERLPADVRTAMMDDQNDPIEVAYYEESVKSLQEAIAEYQKRYDEAEDEAEKVDLRDMLDWYAERLAETEKERWAFSEEDIAFYRQEIARRLVVLPSSIFTGEDNPAQTAIQLYVDGARDADFFLSEIDRIVTFMQNE